MPTTAKVSKSKTVKAKAATAVKPKPRPALTALGFQNLLTPRKTLAELFNLHGRIHAVVELSGVEYVTYLDSGRLIGLYTMGGEPGDLYFEYVTRDVGGCRFIRVMEGPEWDRVVNGEEPEDDEEEEEEEDA